MTGTYEVTTVNGTVYRISYDDRTWERISGTSLSGPVRTDSGSWTELLLVEGFPMIIYGPSLDPKMDVRRITTSEVEKVERID
jgi:hypothetical protein